MKQVRAIISALWVAAAQPSDPNVEHNISLKLSCLQSGTCSRSIVDDEFIRRLWSIGLDPVRCVKALWRQSPHSCWILHCMLVTF